MDFKDRTEETTATTGTGAYTLSGTASVGCQAVGDVYADGAEVPYCCTNGTSFEVGIGTYTASTENIARTTILASSNAGAAVDWAAGNKTFSVVFPAAAMPRYSTSSPTASDNPKMIGAKHVNTTTGEEWVCIDKTAGANVWRGVEQGGRNFITPPLFFLDGSMVSGTPVDLVGAYAFTVGSYGLTSETVTGGTLDGRPAIVASAQIGSNINFTGDEELRFTGNVTMAGWIKLSQTTVGTLFSCNASGESLITNILYDLRLGTDVLFSDVEYSTGTDSVSTYSESISGYAGEWLFFVKSRQADGRTIGLSVWNDSDQVWAHSSLLLPYGSAKATTGNTQVLSLLAYSSAVAGPGMSCAGMAMWGKYFNRIERMALKDAFFTIA